VFLFLRSSSGATARQAFAWALLFALSPPVLSHGFLFFTEVPTALVAMFVFRRLVEEAPAGGAGIRALRTPSATALLGALTGFLVLVHARNVGLAGGLALVAWLQFRRRGGRAPALAFAAGLAAAALLRMWTTWTLWGTLVTTPHAALGTVNGPTSMMFEIFTRVSGLLLDREFGLLAYAPIYLLAAPGLVLVARTRTPVSRGVLLVLACYLAPVLLPLTNVHGWTGGWSPAARFLVPVAPLLWIAVATCGMRAAGWLGAAVAGLAALQVAIDGYLWQSPMSLWNDGDGTSAFALANWLPTWTAPGAAVAFAGGVAAILALSALAIRGAPTMGRPAPPPGAQP
jgi:hypothetical protein